jgi:hypothetical protein
MSHSLDEATKKSLEDLCDTAIDLSKDKSKGRKENYISINFISNQQVLSRKIAYCSNYMLEKGYYLESLSTTAVGQYTGSDHSIVTSVIIVYKYDIMHDVIIDEGAPLNG